jgi:hypothetical protein
LALASLGALVVALANVVRNVIHQTATPARCVRSALCARTIAAIFLFALAFAVQAGGLAAQPFDDGTFRLLDEPRGEPAGAPSTNIRRDDYRGSDQSIDGPNDRLIDRVVDPISWLMQFRFRDDWNWPVEGSGPDSQEFEFRPSLSYMAWDQVNLLRVTVPYEIEGSGAPGLGKVSMFDALVFEPEWGRWGVGPEIRLNPNSSSGDDPFQIGPVFGAVTKSKHWTAGFLVQNFLSANDSESQIQPILAYKFNEKVALTIGDMQFEYAWGNRTWKQLPLGCELDYIADFWGQKVQWFINPQYNFQTTSSSSGWTIFLGLTLLVPDA